MAASPRRGVADCVRMEEDKLKRKLDSLAEAEKLDRKEADVLEKERRELLKAKDEAHGRATDRKLERLHEEERYLKLERLAMHFRRNALPYTIAIILIVVINIWLRTGLLQYQGLFEPDGFFYYTAIKQAIANGFVVSKTVNLSGYPLHNGFNEAPGLPYFTLLPFFFLRFAGIDVYTVMRLVPILFGVLEAALAYYLAQHLTKSKVLGLLAMFFVSASSGNIARTAGGVYRGDTFISFFVIAMLIFMLKALETDNESHMYIYAVAAAVVTAIGPVTWNGGVLTFAIYLVASIFIGLYGFLAYDKQLIDRMVVLMAALFLALLLNNLFIYLGFANPNIMQGGYFMVIFVPLLAGVAAAKALLSGSVLPGLASTLKNRVVFILAFGILAVVLAYALFGPLLIGAVTDQGSVSPINRIAATTQELQKPSLSFLISSFGVQLALGPIGVLVFLLLAHRGASGRTRRLLAKVLWLNANAAFAAVLGYLLFTSYLQASAIRFNALLSIPLALFSAYAVYGLGKLVKDENWAIALGRLPLIRIFYIFLGVATAMLVLQVGYTAIQSFNSGQADGLNPYFLQAMTWLSNNTASNATVLALWPDGSVVEGWGNRTSFMDSVGGENTTRTTQFANFLGNTSDDPQYLIDSAHMPQYMVVRDFWFQELGGLLAEGNSIELQNLTSYGYSPLQEERVAGNVSNQLYVFGNPLYRVEMVIEIAQNGTQKIAALMGAQNRTSMYQMGHVIFLNSTSGTYSMINTTAPGALNYTLFISYLGRNITAATLLAPRLPQSNLFKMLVECGPAECAYNNSQVGLETVFVNPDTKIFKVVYHNAST